MKKPNIVFVFSDQQRWDTLGCYGQPLDVTPRLDAFAAKGIRFENAFTCQPVCGPARSCLQTGKYATQTGCYRNHIALKPDEKTLAHHFAELGYETAYIGKWHLASNGGKSNEDIGPPFECADKAVPPERRGGYQYWLAADALEHTSHGYNGFMFDGDMNKVKFRGYRADHLTDYALKYLDTRGDTPFFLFLSYLEPHHQNDHFRYEGPRGSKKRFKDFVVPGDLAGQGGDWKRNYPDYLGCCNSLDTNFGRILDKLEERGLAENTVVFYTSDHGTHFRTRNNEYKRSCHEASIRIPLLAGGPGFSGGRTIKNLVSLVDLPPTLLSCASIPAPASMSGNPLQKLVKNENAPWPSEVFFQISEHHVGRGLRTARWKYSVRAPEKNGSLDAGSPVYVEDYLYDLENDPHELNNLVSDPDYTAVRKELSNKLKRMMRGAGEEKPEIKPAQ